MLTTALYELIKQHGSRENLAHRLQISVSRLSELLSGHDISLPLALKIDVLSKGAIPAEQLLKHNGKLALSNTVKQIKSLAQQQIISATPAAQLATRPLVSIERPDKPAYTEGYPLPLTTPLRPLLVDETHTLIWGGYIWRQLEEANVTVTKILIINLPALLETEEPLTTPYSLTLLERTAVALALEATLHRLKKENNNVKAAYFCPNLDKLETRKDVLAAKCCQLGSRSHYHKLKYLLKQGHPKLLRALDSGELRGRCKPS